MILTSASQLQQQSEYSGGGGQVCLRYSGTMRVHFNRHGSAPFVWSVVPVKVNDADEYEPICEIVVRSVEIRSHVRTVYLPKDVADDEDGKPSAWLLTTGVLEIDNDGNARVTNG